MEPSHDGNCASQQRACGLPGVNGHRWTGVVRAGAAAPGRSNGGGGLRAAGEWEQHTQADGHTEVHRAKERPRAWA